MAEMVRLTTESSHLKQEKERLQSANEHITEKAANLVRNASRNFFSFYSTSGTGIRTAGSELMQREAVVHTKR